MAVYKVSYVIVGADDPGAIQNQDKTPVPGEKIKIRDKIYEIIEVFELVPPRGEFHYIHATCKSLNSS